MTNEEFVHQLEIMTDRPLCHIGPVPPSMPRAVKEEPPSLPRHRVKQEPPSPLQQVKDEPAITKGRGHVEDPASLPRNRGGDIQIGRHVKEESAPPPAPSCYAHIDGPASPPHRNRRGQFIKDELLPAITKGRGRILHYLGRGDGGGPSGSRTVMSKEDRVVRQQTRYERCNVARCSVFTESNAAPE